jgi:hypothetical protein
MSFPFANYFTQKEYFCSCSAVKYLKRFFPENLCRKNMLCRKLLQSEAAPAGMFFALEVENAADQSVSGQGARGD